MKARRILEWFVYAVGGVYVALFLFSAALRLVYPYEVEWNEGAVLNHAIRVLNGKPIYTAPSLDFAAFVYTPLYYYATAFAMKIGGIGLGAGRFVSILSTLATAFIIGLIVHRETRGSNKHSLLLPISGAMLYLAFYHATGFFYDIVRMDALGLLLATASIYAALYWARGFLISAVLVALAYFTKQQMLFVWPSLAIYFLLRKKRETAWFATVSIGLLVVGTVAMNAATHGWYRFYTYTIPGAKAAAQFSWRDALEFFPNEMFGTIGLFALVILIALIVDKGWMRNRSFVLLLLAGFFAMASGAIALGNPGGYKNVLMPLTAMIAILFPISVERVSEKIQAWPSLAPMLLLLGFLALVYNPLGEKMLFASTRQRRAGDKFIATLREMPGDVWIPFHGYLGSLAGKPTHVHFMAMNDAIFPQDTASARFQREIDSSLAAHSFSAIILDEEGVFHWDSIPHYTRSSAIFQTPNVFLSRLGNAATRPQFIYLPAHDR